jgi:hypothetical protein
MEGGATAYTQHLLFIIVLLNVSLLLLSSPGLVKNEWLKAGLLQFLTPIVVVFLASSDFTSYLNVDTIFLLLALIISGVITYSAMGISKDIQADVKNYGLDPQKTRTLVILRGVGITIGIIISYLVLGKYGVYSKHKVNIPDKI